MLIFDQWSRVDMSSGERQRIADTLSYIHKKAAILSTVEERTVTTVQTRIHEVASKLFCPWQGSRKPDNHLSIFKADYASEELEESEDETREL